MLGNANRGLGCRSEPGPEPGAPTGTTGGVWPPIPPTGGGGAGTETGASRPPLGWTEAGAGGGKNCRGGRGGSWRIGTAGRGGTLERGSEGLWGVGGNGAVRVPSLTTLFTGGGELRAKVHWVLQILSLLTASTPTSEMSWRQLLTRSDWHWAFSRVQVQEVQGDILLLAPRGISIPSTLHLCASSFHNCKLIWGKLRQGTRSLRNSWYWSKADFWILSTTSAFSQTILARVAFLISVSWDSVNLTAASEVSYQNLSHFLAFWNWIPMMQANVGPTRAPFRGTSLRPPVKRSISSTEK